MTFRAEFSPVWNRIVLQTDICNLSGWHKVGLFNALMKELGITERLEETPSCAPALAIMEEQFEKHYTGAPTREGVEQK